MKVRCGMVMVCIVQMGCSSSREVSLSPEASSSFTAFNGDAYGRSAMIVFRDGRELDVRNIVAAPDTTRFVTETIEVLTVVPTHTITKVVFANHGVGFLEGLGWGAGIGAVTGVTFGLIAYKPGGEWGSDVAGISLVVGAVGAVAGGVIGGIIGASVGHSYEYQFVTSANSTTIK